MIVVLIIGILLGIAVPNFVKARQNSRVQTVIAHLKNIESAKDQWAMDTGAVATATPTAADLTPDYLQKWPTGPVGTGADYVANDLPSDPTFKGQAMALFLDPATRDAAIAASGL